MAKDLKNEELMLFGEKKKLLLPSGYEATIREQNGHDDDLLSNEVTARDLSNIDYFLCSLIIDTNLPYAKGGKLNKESIQNMLMRDKYFILFSSRIHSMGELVKFKFDWGIKNGGELTYEESLDQFVWDYSKDMPEEGDENYSKERIQPYQQEKPHDDIEFTLSTGKKLRINMLDNKAEKYILDLDAEQQTRNSEIKARNLQMEENGVWQKVQNFRFFTKREMAQLHKFVNELDPPFRGLTELENPKTGQLINYPIIQAQSFFYPEEI